MGIGDADFCCCCVSAFAVAYCCVPNFLCYWHWDWCWNWKWYWKLALGNCRFAAAPCAVASYATTAKAVVKAKAVAEAAAAAAATAAAAAPEIAALTHHLCQSLCDKSFYFLLSLLTQKFLIFCQNKSSSNIVLMTLLDVSLHKAPFTLKHHRHFGEFQGFIIFHVSSQDLCVKSHTCIIILRS